MNTDHTMTGMATPEQMAELAQSEGTAFRRLDIALFCWESGTIWRSGRDPWKHLSMGSPLHLCSVTSKGCEADCRGRQTVEICE